ncbi:hypothetical protein SK128_027478, partial [Halocaridina rubra]
MRPKQSGRDATRQLIRVVMEVIPIEARKGLYPTPKRKRIQSRSGHGCMKKPERKSRGRVLKRDDREECHKPECGHFLQRWLISHGTASVCPLEHISSVERE